MALMTHHLSKVAIIDRPHYHPAVVAQMEMYATAVSRYMEIAKHDKDTKIFMKIRRECITLRILEKYGHLAAKYHNAKVVYCNRLVAVSCVPGFSVQVDHLKKKSPELFIPPNSTDGTHLKGSDCGTTTHTVVLLPGKEIT
eukprot:15367171-Ditylum_brightwellii.AAC.1